MEVYGIAVFSFFSSGISLILISMCGIAVSSSPAVCGTRYFGICQVFLRYCGIGYPPMSPSFISDAIQFKHFLWLWLEDHDVHMMNLYWKEFASLFQSARVYAVFYFIYAIFRCSDFVLLTFVSADSHITSGRNQKFVELLLISSSSRPNLLCFGFDLNHSQRTIPISRNGYLPDCKMFCDFSLQESYAKPLCGS